MPICVQVTGFSYQDEDVLGIMKVFEKEIDYKMHMNPRINMKIGDLYFDK